jgi:hypothetical protein
MSLRDNIFVKYALKRIDGGSTPKFYGYIPPYGRSLNNNDLILLEDGFFKLASREDKKHLTTAITTNKLKFSTVGVKRHSAGTSTELLDADAEYILAANRGGLVGLPFDGKILNVYCALKDPGEPIETAEATLTIDVTINGVSVFDTAPEIIQDATSAIPVQERVEFGTDQTGTPIDGVTYGELDPDALNFVAGNVMKITATISDFVDDDVSETGSDWDPVPSGVIVVVSTVVLL